MQQQGPAATARPTPAPRRPIAPAPAPDCPTTSPYDGFAVLDGVEVDGFRIGLFEELAGGDGQEGDAFVVAPDGSCAGLAWEVADAVAVAELIPPSPDRWGVWAVAVARPMRPAEAAADNLRCLLPRLRREWLAWRACHESRAGPPDVGNGAGGAPDRADV